MSSSNVTGCSSSSRIAGGGGAKNAGGTLAMIALPVPAPRVRKVPIMLEKDVDIRREGQTKGQEEILDPKEKTEGGTWKARTGLSPGKWATRSLRRSKEETEVKVLPLQRRGSLRGSLRLGRRGEEEENKQVKKKKKEEEGGSEVRQKEAEKERRPLSDLNKAERKPLGERERKQEKGDSKDRKPLTELNQTGGRRSSISGPHQQVFFLPLLLHSEPHSPSSPLTTVKWHSIPTICCRCAPTEWNLSLEPPDLVQVVLHLIIMLHLTIMLLLITMPLQVKVQVVLHPIIMLFHANQTPLNYQRVDQRQS